MDVQHNLYLLTDARVSRVIFEGNKAVGVAYVPSRNRVHGGEVRDYCTLYKFFSYQGIQPAYFCYNDRSGLENVSFWAAALSAPHR